MIARQRMFVAVSCPICGSTQGHEPGCLAAHLEELVGRQKHIECPRCNARDVDLNKDDLYECRQCHTQYTTADLGDNFEKVRLIVDWNAPISEGVQSVLVYPTKGNSEFPIDEAIAKVREEMRKLSRRRRHR